VHGVPLRLRADSPTTMVDVAPRNSLEELVAGVWREVLKVERIGVHDNFIELGGHSLHAMQVAARLAKLLKLDLPMRRFFETASVSALAA
jgi:acyl carrier protein